MMAGQASPRRHVADRRELGGPGEDDRAHRHGLDDREAGFARRQAVDEPEPEGRDRDARRVGDQPAAAPPEVVVIAHEGRVRCARGRGRPRRRLAQEGLPAGPVADDVHGVLLGRVARHVEQARAARGRAFPDPPTLVGVEGRRLRGELGGESRPGSSRARRSRRIGRLRSRWCTGSSGRRWSSRGRVSHGARPLGSVDRDGPIRPPGRPRGPRRSPGRTGAPGSAAGPAARPRSRAGRASR